MSIITALEIVLAVLMLLTAVVFVFGAIRNSKAERTCDQYLVQFEELCDEKSIPFDILESLHTVFKTACHPCAVVYLTGMILKFRTDRSYRQKIDRETSETISHLDPDIVVKISRAAVSLYLYTSYSLPVIGLFCRFLILHMGTKPCDTRKVELFVSAAGHAKPFHVAANSR